MRFSIYLTDILCTVDMGSSCFYAKKKLTWREQMIVDFSKKAFDIMIVAGQSNAEGFGFGDADCPWQPDERVWYLSGDWPGK